MATMNTKTFQGEYGPWALITGASSGLGAEFAKQLAQKGLNLILVARNKGKLQNLADQLGNQYKTEVKTIAVDLSQPDFMSSILPVTCTLEIGLLVNNAGFLANGKFLENDLEQELYTLNLDCRVPLILTHEFGRRMIKRKRGGIIFVSSTIGYHSAPYMVNHAATKSYTLSLGEGLWHELKDQGVNVLVLSPGPTKTEAWVRLKNTGMNPDAIPLPFMPVQPVVSATLKTLGKKPSVIPGWLNQMMTFFMAKLLTRRMATMMWGRLMKSIGAA